MKRLAVPLLPLAIVETLLCKRCGHRDHVARLDGYHCRVCRCKRRFWR